MPRLVHRIGRDISLKEVEQKSQSQKPEQHRLLGGGTGVFKPEIQAQGNTHSQGDPEKVPPVEHSNEHCYPSDHGS